MQTDKQLSFSPKNLDRLCEKTNTENPRQSIMQSQLLGIWLKEERSESPSLPISQFSPSSGTQSDIALSRTAISGGGRQPHQTPFSSRVRRHVPPSAIFPQMEIKRCTRVCDNYAGFVYFVLQRRQWQSLAFQRLFWIRTKLLFRVPQRSAQIKGERGLDASRKIALLEWKSSEFFFSQSCSERRSALERPPARMNLSALLF